MRKKIFITGASGFVGSHLTEAAQKLNLEVHAAVRQSSKTADIKPFVDKFVYPDLGDAEALKKLFDQEKYHFVLHAAAMTKAKDEELMKKVNVGYTEAIIEAALSADMPLERITYVSSLAAIGPIPYADNTFIHEQNPYHPLTVYGRSKKASELMIQEKFQGQPISILRPTAVYGPREKDLFILFDTMKKGLDPYIGNKPQRLSFVYVKDLVDVLLQATLVPQNGMQFYNISDGEVYSKYAMSDIYRNFFETKLWRLHIPFSIVKAVAEFSQFLYKNSDKTPVIYPERLHELTAENWAVDIQHAKDTLGYQPQFNLEKGLKESLAWYKANNWL